MALRAAAFAWVISWVCCVGCRQAQTAQQPQNPPPAQSPPQSLSSQMTPVAESPKFILESPNTFFTKPTSDDLMRGR